MLPIDAECAYVTSCDVPLLDPLIRPMLDFARGYDIAVVEIDGFASALACHYSLY